MEYKVSELAQNAGVTKRTIHYYISKGLLMPPDGTGINSSYNDSHLNRILLIKKLQAEYMPLNKIREYILEGKEEIQIKENNTSIPNVSDKNNKSKEKTFNPMSESGIYMRENICNIFEMHYTQENGEKYRHIIENVKKYVEKMLED